MKLKWKFILIIVLVASLISIVQHLVFHHLDKKLYIESLQNKILVLNRMMGEQTASSIQFNVPGDAVAVLQSLRLEPSVREAYLFDANGELFAEYLAEGEVLSVPTIDVIASNVELVANQMEINHPILLHEKVIGALHIRADLRLLDENTVVRLKFAVMVFFSLLALSFMAALFCQKYFVTPITELASLAEKIGGEEQYSLRASKSSDDELGVLADNFNHMLEEIESRDSQLKAKTLQLQSSNEQLEQFANIAAHDLQEPLRKVRAFADRLIKKCSDELSEQGHNYLTRLDNSVERMQTLITDLLEFSRVKSRAKPFSKTDLKQIASSVVSDLQVKIDELAGEIEIGELPVIDADSLQIQRVLQNLVHNGLKFHHKDQVPIVKISARVQNGNENLCELIVQDNGIGFDEQYTEKIFNPFQCLHGRDEYEGTGMGLAICRRIVERHSGFITASSEPGKGATFIVTLPVTQKEPEDLDT